MVTKQEHRARQHRIAVAQLGAYLLILIVSFMGWGALAEQDKHICRSAEENRDAVRGVVIGVNDLGRDLVLGGNDNPTPEQDAVLAKFDEYKKQQLKNLEGPVC